MKRKIRLLYICLALSIGVSACVEEEDTIEISDGEITVCYRGERVTASLVGGELVVEGDILVAPSDQWCNGDETTVENGVKQQTQSVRIQGKSFRWNKGIVPYRFGSDPDSDGDGTVAADITAAQRQDIRDQMDEIERSVPGLTFREARASDTDIIEFRPSLIGCNSMVGRIGGVQVINLTNSCMASYSAAHEIIHALGVYHQHSRKDRDDFVTINWQNIKGCRSTATSSSQCGSSACSGHLADCGCTATDIAESNCYMAGNFTTNSSRADIGRYDYDSVMHYPRDGFSKGGDTITPNEATAAIGQRTFLSAGDTSTLRAIYPTLKLLDSAFVTAGLPVELCRLEGREDDAATKYRLINPGGAKAYEFGGNFTTFNSDVGIRVYNRECDARSNFWDRNYDYPNSDASRWGSNPTSYDELFKTEDDVVLLSSGLIPVFI